MSYFFIVILQDFVFAAFPSAHLEIAAMSTVRELTRNTLVDAASALKWVSELVDAMQSAFVGQTVNRFTLGEAVS